MLHNFAHLVNFEILCQLLWPGYGVVFWENIYKNSPVGELTNTSRLSYRSNLLLFSRSIPEYAEHIYFWIPNKSSLQSSASLQKKFNFLTYLNESPRLKESKLPTTEQVGRVFNVSSRQYAFPIKFTYPSRVFSLLMTPQIMSRWTDCYCFEILYANDCFYNCFIWGRCLPTGFLNLTRLRIGTAKLNSPRCAWYHQGF